MLKSYRDLEVWNRAHALVLEVYRLTNPFPRSEQFGVVSQIRRAAYSIPANIAEGFGRRSTRELLQFISFANGSLEELRHFLLLSRDLRYLSPVDFANLEKELKAVAQMLEGLAKSLRERIARATAGGARNANPISNGGSAPSFSSRNTEHGSRDTKTIRGVAH